jgi:hypothetical protein
MVSSRKTLPMHVANGPAIFIEVREHDPSAAKEGDLKEIGGVREMAKKTFEAAVEDVSRIAAVFHERLCAGASRANEVTVEFGFDITAGSDVVVVSGETTASFKVTLLWK